MAKLEEDLRSKEQRRKDKEKRKELKKEKKKEKREKERHRERDDKGERKSKEKVKEKTREFMEQTVPKLTLKIHSNASTPVDSPRTHERTDTPPPPPRKITIKPIEDIVKRRTPSPELARFSPLVTRYRILQDYCILQNNFKLEMKLI